jgi:SAM-dependent methyltransferase
MASAEIAPTVTERYDTIAEQHLSQVFEGPFNEYYERPVMHALLGDVAGQRVLDAGCGPGDYAAWLVAHGAQVLAFDSSPAMVQIARERMGKRAEIRQADLNEPLSFIETCSWDTVLCSLVLDYLEGWDRPFNEFNRVLRPSGRVIFSVHHPFFLDLKLDVDVSDSYFDVQQVEEDWLPFGFTIPAFRRSLSAISAALWRAGFVIVRIVEPKPTMECKHDYPEFYARLSGHPVFICFSARKG